MFNRILPRLASSYTGQPVALWVFAFVLLSKLFMSGNVIFNGTYVATRADGVPLASYPPEAARTVLALFGIWGIGQLMLCLLGGVVLWRYRGLVSLMIAVQLLEQVLRRVFLHYVPVHLDGTSSATYVNSMLLALTALSLVLSLVGRRPAGEASRQG